MYFYCIFCATVKCDLVASAIRQKFGITAFSPRIVQRKWIKGACFEEEKPYLPGYIFVCTEEPVTNFREIYTMEGVIRCLGQRDEGYQLQGDDLRFARMLYEHNGVIGIMKTYREGDRVKLVKHMMGDFDARIIKLDPRKGRAQLQYEFDGSSYKVWVGYDMIDDTEIKPDVDERAEPAAVN